MTVIHVLCVELESKESQHIQQMDDEREAAKLMQKEVRPCCLVCSTVVLHNGCYVD